MLIEFDLNSFYPVWQGTKIVLKFPLQWNRFCIAYTWFWRKGLRLRTAILIRMVNDVICILAQFPRTRMWLFIRNVWQMRSDNCYVGKDIILACNSKPPAKYFWEKAERER